jgi:acyl-CoA thioesterase
LSNHPFADLLGFAVNIDGSGSASASITVDPQRHFNPQGAAHGGLLYALADTAMGAALYTGLEAGEYCATIEIKISYFAPVRDGELRCEAVVVNRGKRVAHLTAVLENSDRVVGQANGSFAIFRPGG